MPSTYEPIATQTLGSAATTVTFSSISGSFTDLVIVASIQSTASANADTRCWLRFNNDSATNYSTTYLLGNGIAASSARDTTRAQVDNVTTISTTPQFTPVIYNVMNYSNATTYKTALQRSGQNNNTSGGGGGGGILMGAAVSLWRSTSAITRVDLTCAVNGQFATGSTFTLYGVKSA
jgi:hypothetical protein